MNQPLPPANHCPPRAINDRINDTVSGTVVTVNEWLRNELLRLQNNIRPRHCETYDVLVSFIVDPRLLEPLKAPNPCPLMFTLPLNSFTSEEEDEDGDDIEEHDEENIEEWDEVEAGSSDEEGSEEDESDDDMIDDDHSKNIPIILSATSHQCQHGPNLPSFQTHRKLSTTLCRVFLEMMRYCGKVSTTINNAPRLLLSEFDKLRQDVKNKQAINAVEFRDKLLKLLFGKIQMTEYLIKCWKFICEWVTRPPLQNQTHARKWIEMTLSAFVAAKKLFLKEHIHDRQNIQEHLQRRLQQQLC
ncbi:unnamed protein product [Mucor hiemalis]